MTEDATLVIRFKDIEHDDDVHAHLERRLRQITHDFPEASHCELSLTANSIDVSAHALSGGNQQKLIIGRELTSNPEMLIASHPTRGIDVGAQAAVWDQIRAARRNGLATLLISADLDELIGLSDTIVVMLRGEFVATLSPDEVTPRDLGAYMTGAALQNGGAA